MYRGGSDHRTTARGSALREPAGASTELVLFEIG